MFGSDCNDSAKDYGRRRPHLRVVDLTDDVGGDEHPALHLSRSTNGPEPLPTGRAWMQILGVINDLQLAIQEHQRDRIKFEQWVARERASIAREREALRKSRGNHRFW